MRLPDWLIEGDREGRQRFFLRLAAIYLTPDGSQQEMAGLLGVAETTVSRWAQGRGEVPPEIIVKLENAIGRDVIRREVVRPDLFQIEGKKEGPEPESGA